MFFEAFYIHFIASVIRDLTDLQCINEVSLTSFQIPFHIHKWLKKYSLWVCWNLDALWNSQEITFSVTSLSERICSVDKSMNEALILLPGFLHRRLLTTCNSQQRSSIISFNLWWETILWLYYTKLYYTLCYTKFY